MQFDASVYCWRSVGQIIFWLIPTPLFSFRRWFLSLWGAQLHSTVRIYEGVRIFDPRNLRVEAHGCIGPRCNIHNTTQVRVGEGAVLSFECVICTATKRRSSDCGELIFYDAPVVIGKNCFIGAQSFISFGVVLPDKSFVKARELRRCE